MTPASAGPLTHPRLLLRLRPFAVAVVVGLAGMFVPDQLLAPWSGVAAVAVLAVVVACGLWLPWRRWPASVQVAVPLGFVLVVCLLRDSGGGANGGYGALFLLPVIWVALYGTRRDLYLVLAGVLLAYAAPDILIGAPNYPLVDLRKAALFLVVAFMVGQAVQSLVRTQRRQTIELDASEGALRKVADSVREISSSGDARAGVCAAARDIGGADCALLWESEGESMIRMTAQAGCDIPAIAVRIGTEPSGAGIAMASGQRFFVPDAVGNPAISQRLREMLELESLLFEPIFRDGKAVGVMTVGWRTGVGKLQPRVESALSLLAAEAATVIEREDLLHRLESLSLTDALTGLPNRRAWEEELGREMTRAQRHGTPLSLALLDLDHFKSFNDRLGHQAGDLLLKECAAAWPNSLREVDFLARYGGEEFIVMLPECPLDEALGVLERLRATTPGEVTCSIGVVEWDGEETDEQVVARADEALYAAKNAGRNRVMVGSPPGRV